MSSLSSLRWTEKYRPRTLDVVLGNGKAVSELRAWAMSWESGNPTTKAAILYGPAGIGKTSAAIALANEFDWDYIEMNASDARTAGMINKIAGPAASSGTFSGKRRLVVLDEADNLHGTADRGGAAAILKLARTARQPVLLIANEYYEIDKQLREASKGIQFRTIRSTTIASTLREICDEEGIHCDPEALIKIADLAGGDLRSAVNDLQAAAQGSTELKPEDVATAERDVRSSIFKVLDKVFKGSDPVEALEASYMLDESPEDLINWVDENLPLAYEGEELARGYDVLSRADQFLGRVRIRQNYGLWRYASFLMTGGIQAARIGRRSGYIAFKPPGLWRRMGQSKKARNTRDSAASKIARHIHTSSSYVRSELMDFIGMLLKSKAIAPKVAAELDLNIDEIALLMESSATTKKVQSIFDRAQKIREAEISEEIELGWHRPDGQRALIRDTSSVAPEKGSGQNSEPLLQDAEAAVKINAEVKSEPKEPEPKAVPEVASKPESELKMQSPSLPQTTRKASREKALASQPKIDNEPDKESAKPNPSTRDQAGKRQKSLLEFDLGK